MQPGGKNCNQWAWLVARWVYLLAAIAAITVVAYLTVRDGGSSEHSGWLACARGSAVFSGFFGAYVIGHGVNILRKTSELRFDPSTLDSDSNDGFTPVEKMRFELGRKPKSSEIKEQHCKDLGKMVRAARVFNATKADLFENGRMAGMWGGFLIFIFFMAGGLMLGTHVCAPKTVGIIGLCCITTTLIGWGLASVPFSWYVELFNIGVTIDKKDDSTLLKSAAECYKNTPNASTKTVREWKHLKLCQEVMGYGASVHKEARKDFDKRKTHNTRFKNHFDDHEVLSKAFGVKRLCDEIAKING